MLREETAVKAGRRRAGLVATRRAACRRAGAKADIVTEEKRYMMQVTRGLRASRKPEIGLGRLKAWFRCYHRRVWFARSYDRNRRARVEMQI